MKSTGVVRRIDELGRFVIPKEIRAQLDIVSNTPIEILVDDRNIILRKYEHDKVCVFCSSEKDVKLFKGKYICQNCIDELL